MYLGYNLFLQNYYISPKWQNKISLFYSGKGNLLGSLFSIFPNKHYFSPKTV